MSVKAYLSDITQPEERAGVFGRFNAFGSLGFIIAPIIGGTVAMQENGFFKVTLMTCTVYLIGLAFVWFVFENKKVKKDEGASLPTSEENVDENNDKSDEVPSSSTATRRKNLDTKPEAELVKKNQDDNGSTISKLFSFIKIDSVKHVLDLLLIRFVMSLSMLIYRSNFTAMLDYRYGIDTKMTGYIISYGSTVGALSGMSVGTIYSYVQSDGKMMFFASILMTVSLFGITISPSIYTVLVFMAPLSLSTAIQRCCSHNLALQRIKPEEKGAVMGVGDSLTSIARMFSPAIAGFALEASVTGPCWLATGFALIGIGISMAFKRYKPITGVEKKND